jgi:DNA-directed RNA polymerase subunit beta
MTKRGHFILNGSARVIINQIIRSPGLYYQKKLYETFTNKWTEKPEPEYTYRRSYVDIICLRGTWLRVELDKKKKIWAQTKKGPKIPIIWFLLGMGINEQILFNTILEPILLFQNVEEKLQDKLESKEDSKQIYLTNPSEVWEELNKLIPLKSKYKNKKKKKNSFSSSSNLGRQWLFNKFMNPKNYDLGKQGRLAINKKLGLNIAANQLTLTPQDLLYAINHLIKVEKGIENVDDIDHLKNRRVRTSGELIQIQIGIGLNRLETSICEKLNEYNQESSFITIKNQGNLSLSSNLNQIKMGDSSSVKSKILENNLQISKKNSKNIKKIEDFTSLAIPLAATKSEILSEAKLQPLSNPVGVKKSNILLGEKKLIFNNLINTKSLNSALREFFGSSPLSQFMDQINPLAEITHKRRLSSMGPGGVTRDTATLEIRGIHPTHYGRICPVETPEGKNTGLVNSLTTYSRVNNQGILESPFYKVYKGQVQKKAGIFFLSAEDEDQIKLAAADLFISSLNFLPLSSIPVRIGEDFSKIARHEVQYIGIAPIQMISIATSLIPFLEHDDANRALMGSNMQRQAVPLLKLDRPIVGTGLEGRAVSDSGHIIEARLSGLVTYVSGQKIIVTTILND